MTLSNLLTKLKSFLFPVYVTAQHTNWAFTKGKRYKVIKDHGAVVTFINDEGRKDAWYKFNFDPNHNHEP